MITDNQTSPAGITVDTVMAGEPLIAITDTILAWNHTEQDMHHQHHDRYVLFEGAISQTNRKHTIVILFFITLNSDMLET